MEQVLKPDYGRADIGKAGSNMANSLAELKKHRAWQNQHDPLAPKASDLAPDFELRDTNGENPVRLSDFRSKQPVALVFGSFT